MHAIIKGTSNACTTEPSGENLCIRHVAGYCLRAGIDPESLGLDGGNNLMGFDDSLDGFEHAVVCGSYSFSSVTDVLGFCVSRARCCVCSRPFFRHLCVPGRIVNWQAPRLWCFVDSCSFSATSQGLVAAVVQQLVRD